MIAVEVVREVDLLDLIHARILTPAFRETELIPAWQLREAVASGVYEVLAVMGEDGPQAVAVGEFSEGLVLLVYLAVAPGIRSRGTGGDLLDAALARWQARPGVRLVLAELDRPDFHTADALQGDPDRRLGFYARHGGRALDLPYFQPSVGQGLPRVHGMLLIVLGADPEVLSPAGGRLVEVGPLRRFLAGHLEETEEPDGAARQLLDGLDAPGGVALVPLAGYSRIRASAPAPGA